MFTARIADGEPFDFECLDNVVSRWVCGAVLEGDTYPHLPFVDGVEVVLDVGANCGAAAVFFAHHHPTAAVHAFEPAAAPLACLHHNLASLPLAHVQPFGLFSSDGEVTLHHDADDPGSASVHDSLVEAAGSETVALRAAGPWAAENGIERIDILKIDTEGCEIDVLRSLGPLVATTKVIYLEYHSRADRRALGPLLEPSHELYAGKMFLDQGECVYLRRDLAELPEANRPLSEMFAAEGAADG